jgi:hypothetical protein
MSNIEIFIRHREIGYDSFEMQITVSHQIRSKDVWTQFSIDWIRDSESANILCVNEILKCSLSTFAGNLSEHFLYKVECPFVCCEKHELNINEMIQEIMGIYQEMIYSINISKRRHTNE